MSPNDLLKERKALPILAFPSVSLLGCSVYEIVTDSEKQADGMAAIAERFPVGASFGFMDLSVESECFGARVAFSKYEVPTVTGALVSSAEDAEALPVPGIGTARSGIFLDAVSKAKKRLDLPVFPGMIGPFSLAARLCGVSEILYLCYDEPQTVETVLKKATAFLVSYAKALRDAGADGILLAEPVAGLVSPDMEAQFSAPYVREIVSAVQSDAFPVIYHNCGSNPEKIASSLISSGAAAYHFGNASDMSALVGRFGDGVPVLGNVDPASVLCKGTPASVYDATRALLDSVGNEPSFLLSSGCDIPPAAPLENIDAFFRASEDFYGKLR